jgi:hypothetical protein
MFKPGDLVRTKDDRILRIAAWLNYPSGKRIGYYLARPLFSNSGDIIFQLAENETKLICHREE